MGTLTTKKRCGGHSILVLNNASTKHNVINYYIAHKPKRIRRTSIAVTMQLTNAPFLHHLFQSNRRTRTLKDLLELCLGQGLSPSHAISLGASRHQDSGPLCFLSASCAGLGRRMAFLLLLKLSFERYSTNSSTGGPFCYFAQLINGCIHGYRFE